MCYGASGWYACEAGEAGVDLPWLQLPLGPFEHGEHALAHLGSVPEAEQQLARAGLVVVDDRANVPRDAREGEREGTQGTQRQLWGGAGRDLEGRRGNWWGGEGNEEGEGRGGEGSAEYATECEEGWKVMV